MIESFRVLIPIAREAAWGAASREGDSRGEVDEREDRNDAGAGDANRDYQGVLRRSEDGGRAWQALAVASWKLPLVVAAIAVPIIAAFYVSPGLGLAAGALAAVAIVVVAVRQRPRGAIGRPVAAADGRYLLVVATRPVEDPATVREISAIANEGREVAADVLVISPARIGFLDRWASDVEGARREAQKRLVITVASLARTGLSAEARVGDEDLVQAVEDQLESFDATTVVLVTGAPEEDPGGEAAAAELEQRLQTGFKRLVISGPAAR
jgi:hypothetical protein